MLMALPVLTSYRFLFNLLRFNSWSHLLLWQECCPSGARSCLSCQSWVDLTRGTETERRERILLLGTTNPFKWIISHLVFVSIPNIVHHRGQYHLSGLPDRHAYQVRVEPGNDYHKIDISHVGGGFFIFPSWGSLLEIEICVLLTGSCP